MKLLWAPNVKFTRALYAAAGDKSTDLHASASDHNVRIDRPFPLLIDDSGRLCREAFEFLYDMSVRGSSESAKTLATYAESLCDWLSFAQRQSPQHLIPTRRRLMQYRAHLLGADNGSKGRRLSNRTINLRLTVANEFAKFSAPDSASSDAQEVGSGGGAAQNKIGPSNQQSGRNRLLLRLTKKRPRVLKKDAIRALLPTLQMPHRLAFQWQLCTGLRRGSVVALTLDHIAELCGKFSDGFIDVPTKGGYMATVYVPPPLLDETLRYVQTDRMSVASIGLSDLQTSINRGALFLNTKGRPLTAECYYRAFHRACNKIALKAKTHLARSTYASHMERLLSELRARGEMIDPVKVVQGLLGHADSSTTAIYLDSIAGRNINVLEALSSLAHSMIPGGEHD